VDSVHDRYILLDGYDNLGSGEDCP
jgi:hypothetical protein